MKAWWLNLYYTYWPSFTSMSTLLNLYMKGVYHAKHIVYRTIYTGSQYRIQIRCKYKYIAIIEFYLSWHNSRYRSAICVRQHKSIYFPLGRARRRLRTFVDPLRRLRIATNHLRSLRVSKSFFWFEINCRHWYIYWDGVSLYELVAYFSGGDFELPEGYRHGLTVARTVTHCLTCSQIHKWSDNKTLVDMDTHPNVNHAERGITELM